MELPLVALLTTTNRLLAKRLTTLCEVWLERNVIIIYRPIWNPFQLPRMLPTREIWLRWGALCLERLKNSNFTADTIWEQYLWTKIDYFREIIIVTLFHIYNGTKCVSLT